MKYIRGINEAFIGPFVFSERMSDDELKGMYNAAIDGYSYHQKGMQYSKSDYKKAYMAIEKILKKRGVKVDEGRRIDEGGSKNLKDMSDTDLIATLDHLKTGPANIRDLSDRLIKNIEKEIKRRGIKESVTDASNNLEKIFGTDQETMDMFQRIEDEGTVKDMIEFIDEFGNEEMLSRYGIRSTAQVKKLAKTIMNEAIDMNDPVLIAFRATRRELPKFKPAKAKSRRLSFDKYMDLLDARMDVDQQIKDLGDEMAQTLRDMEQEAEPEGGEVADRYGSIMMKQEKEYAKLKAKKDKIMARIDKHRMD